MSDPQALPDFAQVKLSGQRFENGRLPVSALSELEKYTKLILEGAKIAWGDDHPDEPLPENFGSDFDLVLTSVGNGSAECHLGRLTPWGDDEVDYYDEGRELIGREIREVLRGQLDEIDELIASIDAFGDFGSSLQEGDYIEVPSTPDEEPVRITLESYRERIRPAYERSRRDSTPRAEVRAKLYSKIGWVVGRLGALDVDDSRFNMTTHRFGPIHGRWSNPKVFSDLRSVIDSSERAAIVRVYGSLRLRSDNDLYRLNDASEVEFLATEGEPWSRRFIELASLEQGWGDDEYGEPISLTALAAARSLLTTAIEAQKIQPGIFPKIDGGVGLEWSSPTDVVSIDISDEAQFFIFRLGPDDVAFSLETGDISQVEDFIKEVEF